MNKRIISLFLVLACALGLVAQPAIGTPIPMAAKAETQAGTDATSSASVEAAAPAASQRFLGFESKEAFHRASGWISGGTLLAAGIVGAVHAYGMMTTAHAYRDSHNIEEFDPVMCPGEIEAVYGDPTQVALHWTHVGLLGVGESFYLANAITGSGFIGPLPPGYSKAKAHRLAFFAHAGLMVAEAVLGFVSSDALERGDHQTFSALLGVHAGIGIAVPALILGAGALMN
jgi:hypothetical protein